MISHPTLLSVWKDNLTADYQQSIYWNAVPSYLNNYLDLCDVEGSDPQKPISWIRQLLDTSAMGVEINPAPSLLARLRHLHFESLAAHDINGQPTTGLGYPLLVQRDPENPQRVMASPLFVWELLVEPHPKHSDHWVLRRPIQAPIMVNEFLLHYLKERHGLDLFEQARNMVVDNRLSQLELLKVCSEIALTLDLKGSYAAASIKRCPMEDDLWKETSDGGFIAWVGVVGLFKPLNTSVLKILSEPVAEEKTGEFEPWAEVPVSPFLLDPYQQAAFRALQTRESIVLEGAAGTGKTHTVGAMIAAALAQRRRVLVVSNKKATLQRIKEKLQEVGLADLALTLTNPHADREAVIAAVVASASDMKRLPPFEEEDLLRLERFCARRQAKLDEFFERLSAEVFDQHNWTSLVGKFLESHYREGRQLLSSQVAVMPFLFNGAEYHHLAELVEKSYGLYRNLNTLKHPLRVLRPEIFTERTHLDAKAFVLQQGEQLLRDLNALYYESVNYLEGYADELSKQFDAYSQNIRNKSYAIQENIDDFAGRYGKRFNYWNLGQNMRLRLAAIFSAKSRYILNTKRQVRAAYDDLQGVYEHKRYFSFSFMRLRAFRFDRMKANLKSLLESLEEWRATIPVIVQQQVQKVSPHYVHPDLEGHRRKALDLATHLKELLENINERHLFVKRFTVDAETIYKQRGELEDFIEIFENLLFNLRDFDAYYHWTSHWLQMNPHEQQLIKALVKTKPANWRVAFDSWYFYNVLTRHYKDGGGLEDDQLLKEFGENSAKLRELLPKKVLKYWKFRQSAEWRRARKDNKDIQNLFFSKTKDKLGFLPSFQELVVKDFELTRTLFPVILATPNIVNEFLPAQKELFDLLIVQDADEVQAEELVGALWRTRQHIIVGDNQLSSSQMSLASLLATAKQSNSTYFKLHYAHEVIHPQLLRLRRAAFYAGDLEKSPVQPPKWGFVETAAALRFFEVGGLYLSEERVNEQEAQAVMHLLNDIAPDPTGKYPTVGIACTTPEQRNTIIHYIRQIKRHRVTGTEKVIQLEMSGLNVFYINDLKNYRFDVLIISTVFAEDDNGVFTADALRLNQLEGLRALCLAVTAATQKLLFCSSIPEAHIRHYARPNKAMPGLFLLMNLLLYAKAVEEGNIADQEQILQRLADRQQLAEPNAATAQAKLFAAQVRAKLGAFFPANRIVDANIEGIPLDFIILPSHENGKAYAVAVDGIYWRFPTGGYLWELRLRDELQNMGYEYLPMWSAGWVRSPDSIAGQYAVLILKDEEPLSTPLLAATNPPK